MYKYNKQKTMKSIFKYTLLLYCLWFWNNNLVAQVEFQTSVNEGFGIRISGITELWKANIITEKRITGPGVDIAATYGISEKIGLYGNFQHIFGAKLSPVEVDFLIYTNRVSHQNLKAGLRYVGGSTSSKIRYTVEAGILRPVSVVQLFQDQFDNFIDMRLKGIGFSLDAGLAYFASPFLSLDLTAGYGMGKYRSSEYLGITYKESLQWSQLQITLGAHYHFAGR
jgi:hypothetical protein